MLLHIYYVRCSIGNFSFFWTLWISVTGNRHGCAQLHQLPKTFTVLICWHVLVMIYIYHIYHIYTYILYIYRIYYYLRKTLTHYIEETPINIYEGAVVLFTQNYRKGRRFEISKRKSRNHGLVMVQCMNDTLS